jgi:hypothetical protein
MIRLAQYLLTHGSVTAARSFPHRFCIITSTEPTAMICTRPRANATAVSPSTQIRRRGPTEPRYTPRWLPPEIALIRAAIDL